MTLSTFPESGFCRSTDNRIESYLLASGRKTKETRTTINPIGIAWNDKSYWLIMGGSEKKEYQLDDIKQFLEQKQDLSKTVVHCTTQEEWDYIKSYCRKESAMYKAEWVKTNPLKFYPEGIAISIDLTSYCGLNYWNKNGFTVISFSDWCKQNNYKPIEMDKEELLAKANRDYPVGTQFYSASSGDKLTVLKEAYWYSNFTKIATKDGCNGVVYYEGKWAEIISKPETKSDVYPFVKGKYYSFEYGTAKYWFEFVKLYSVRQIIICFGYRYENPYYKKSWQPYNNLHLAVYEDVTNFKEVTEQEAKGIEVTEQEWIPKVGEKIITFNTKYISHEQVKTISKIEGERLYFESSAWMLKQHCRKALPHEIPLTTEKLEQVVKEITFGKEKRSDGIYMEPSELIQSINNKIKPIQVPIIQTFKRKHKQTI